MGLYCLPLRVRNIKRMKEYYGKSAQIYGQTRGKSLLLIPAIARHLPRAEDPSRRLLDIGCGNGDLFSLVESKGYEYFGLDVSDDILQRSRATYPTGSYTVGDARNLKDFYKDPFDALIVSMLLPSLDKREDILQILIQCRELMSNNATLLVAVTHPSFDHYMQSFLFQRKDVQTDFSGYYTSGARFVMDQQINGQPFTFEDYHWTLQDYINAIVQSGLKIITVDECKSERENLSKEDQEWAKKRDNFPTYMVFVLGK